MPDAVGDLVENLNLLAFILQQSPLTMLQQLSSKNIVQPSPESMVKQNTGTSIMVAGIDQ